jgi:hypothetical protein
LGSGWGAGVPVTVPSPCNSVSLADPSYAKAGTETPGRYPGRGPRSSGFLF